VLTTESGHEETPEGGEVLAALADGPSYHSSVSVPTSSGTPNSDTSRNQQSQTLPRGILRIPKDAGVSKALTGLNTGEYPNLASEEAFS